MGPFAALLWISHSAGLFLQLNASRDVEVNNHVYGNALFTEVPHDVITQSGQDVEMACSFRGSGPSSVSLEIQWWYLRYHREWSEKPTWATNQVVSTDESMKDATKISVVKVAGSNISHRLRLSNVKQSDEGMYECRVIDFSNNRIQQHRVQAYLQVQPQGPDSQLHQEENLHSEEQSLGNHGNNHLHKRVSQISVRDKHNNNDQELHHGDYLHHQIDHHKSHHAKEGGKKTSSPTLQHEDHNVKEHQHHHNEKNPQMKKHMHSSKNREAKNHQSDLKGHNDHDAELHSNNCSTSDCVL